MSFSITGNLVDVHKKKIYPAEVIVENGRIVSIKEQPPLTPPTGENNEQTPHKKAENNIDTSLSEPLQPSKAPLPEGFGEAAFILPGFIDAHVHIESSMLIPSEFARLAVVHGTVATVSDPHEIANVCGMQGIDFMIENGKTVQFKFYFGAPSCVPATTFETAGATINVDDVYALMSRDEIKYLSEMMNFPGVLSGDEDVMNKIAAAKKYGKPIDGHAPGLRGDAAKKYIDAGLPAGQASISTDHECFTKEEALDKLKCGMKIIIREGSAAKNFDALIDLLHDHPDEIMFCSDDKHPDSLVEGHINQLCARAVAKGIDVFKTLQAACVNPVRHYKLDVGLLGEGDPADFIVVKDLENFEVLQTYVNGELVAENGKSLIVRRETSDVKVINNFNCSKKKPEDFAYPATSEIALSDLDVIEALDGQLITNKIFIAPKIEFGDVVPDIENDILKIVVVNRYTDSPVAKAFVKNFGIKKGAIASSVAHDSHNIVAVGSGDHTIASAVNLIINNKGGISVVSDYGELCMALPVGGLMSTDDGYEVAKKYSEMDKAAKELRSTLSAPFMTLSFMALLVIPHLKLSDKGLFDGDKFKLIDLP